MARVNRKAPGAPLVVSILLALSAVAAWHGWATGQITVWRSAPWATAVVVTAVTTTNNAEAFDSPGCQADAPLDANREAWVNIGLPDGIHVMVVRKGGDVLITPPAGVVITGGALTSPTADVTFAVDPSQQFAGRAVRVHGAPAGTGFVTITCSRT